MSPMQKVIDLSPREFREAIEGTPLARIYDDWIIRWRAQGFAMADAVVSSLLAWLIQLSAAKGPRIQIR